MYDPKYEEIHVKLVYFTYLIGFSPIYYDRRSEKFKISVRGTLLSTLNLTILLTSSILHYPTNIGILFQNRDFQELIFTAVVWLATMLGVVILGNYLWSRDEICQMWNGYPQYLIRLEESAQLDKEGYGLTKKIFHALLFTATYASAFAGISLMIHCFFFPTSGPYLMYGVPQSLVTLKWRIFYTLFMGVSTLGTTMLLALLRRA